MLFHRTSDELKEFFESYKSLPEDYTRGWRYSRIKDFINKDKTILLTLIDILESPKPEADKKLAELEVSLAEMFTEKEK